MWAPTSVDGEERMNRARASPREDTPSVETLGKPACLSMEMAWNLMTYFVLCTFTSNCTMILPCV